MKYSLFTALALLAASCNAMNHLATREEASTFVATYTEAWQKFQASARHVAALAECDQQERDENPVKRFEGRSNKFALAMALTANGEMRKIRGLKAHVIVPLLSEIIAPDEEDKNNPFYHGVRLELVKIGENLLPWKISKRQLEVVLDERSDATADQKAKARDLMRHLDPANF